MLELLLGAAAGALILAALAQGLALFDQHVEAVRGVQGAKPEDAVALMCDMSRHAYWVQSPSPGQLHCTDAAGAVTRFELEGSALRVTRPSGAVGVLLPGVHDLAVETDAVQRLREAEPAHADRTWWAADLSAADPGADPVAFTVEDGLPAALGFTMASAVPDAFDTVDGVDEYALGAALESFVVPLAYLAVVPDDPNAPFTGDGDADGDAEGDDGKKPKEHKSVICHVPPGNPDNAHTIEVADSAVDAHLAHGDSLGPCNTGDDDPTGGGAQLMVELFRARAPDDARPHGPSLGALTIPAWTLPPAHASWVLCVPGPHDESEHSLGVCEATTSDGKVILCHKPPTEPAGAHAIAVEPELVASHLAHGDYLGCCGDHGETDAVYTLSVDAPTAATVIDLSSLGATIEPGVAYTLVLHLAGPGTLSLASQPLPSAQHSGVAQSAAVDGPLTALPARVDFQLAGSQTITQTEAFDCVSRVTLTLDMGGGDLVQGSASVTSQTAVPDVWFGVAPPDVEGLQP